MTGMMKNSAIFRRLFPAWVLASVLMLSACAPSDGYRTVDGVMLGTSLHVTGDGIACSRSALYASLMELDRQMKASMSIFDESSLLSRLNRNETDSVDAHIERNLALAERVSVLSGGRYDVTVKPLVEAFGFAGHARAGRTDVDSLLCFVGHDKIRVLGGRLVKDDPRVQIDLNSIAKGYAVDRVAELMERCGARNYLVDVGGEIRCRGVNPQGNPWRVGIETPFDGNMSEGEYVSVRIRPGDGAMATSGNYRRFYIDAEGRKVAHTIDPLTGRSALSGLLSVTVVADSCILADALGTMFMALGDTGALALANRMEGLKACFILSDGKEGYRVWYTPAMEALTLRDDE